MDKQPPDFWAMEDRRLLERWPKTSDGQPQPAAKLAIQWELDSMADITLSLLESCVPADRLEEAQALLDSSAEPEEPV